MTIEQAGKLVAYGICGAIFGDGDGNPRGQSPGSDPQQNKNRGLTLTRFAAPACAPRGRRDQPVFQHEQANDADVPRAENVLLKFDAVRAPRTANYLPIEFPGAADKR